MAAEKHGWDQITSFSDNRLHDGKMYRSVGFRLVGEIPPDYQYTNGLKREHKFKFRVKKGVNEVEEAKKRNFDI